MNRRGPTLLATLGMMLAACVDVPQPVEPVDGGATDRGPDARPLDQGPPADPAADAGPDVDSEPPPRCLAPLDGPRGDDAPCLEVWSAAPLREARVHAAGGAVRVDGAPVVVISGGYLPGAADRRADAESWIYDPRADRWSAGPGLRQARWGHAAGVTADGVLLVAGGAAGFDADGGWDGLGSAERFGVERWTTLPGDLEPPRGEATAASLADGRVVLLGGRSTHDGAPLAHSAALAGYGITNLGAVLARPRAETGGARLPDDRLLLVGGYDAMEAVEAVPELGRGDGALFAEAPAPPVGGGGSTVGALSDGALIVGGAGADDAGRETDAWRFSPTYDRFVPLPRLATPRIRPSVSPIGPPGGDWRLVAGGDDEGVVELYDPIGDRLRVYPLPPPWDHGRQHHVAAAFEVDGRIEVVLVGGQTDPAGDAAEQAPITHVLRFRLTPPPPSPPIPPLPDGCLPVPGVEGPTPCLRIRRGPPLPEPLAELGVEWARDGEIIITGGLDPRDGHVSDATATLHPNGRIWRPGPPLNTARWGHQMLTADIWYTPNIFVYGGATSWLDGRYEATASVESWFANDGQATWVTRAAQLVAPRVDFATSRPGAWGVGLLHGGRSSSDGPPLDSGEFISREVVVDAPLPLGEARIDAAGCPLGVELVVFGGHDGAAVLDSVEARSEGDGSWQLISRGQPRAEHACVSHDGVVDYFGGREAVDGPPTDIWQRLEVDEDGYPMRLMPSLGRARAGATVSAIGRGENDSRAWLVVGGEDPETRAATAVDLIFPALPDGARRVYTALLPESVAPRRAHRAIAREIRPYRDAPLVERDVVVLGGLAPDGAPLDEVLIFSLDPFDPPGGLGPVEPPLD